MNQERGRFLQLLRLKTSLPKRNQPSFLKHSSDLCLGWKCPAVVIFIFWITVHKTHSVSLWEGGSCFRKPFHCNSSQEVGVLSLLSFLRLRLSFPRQQTERKEFLWAESNFLSPIHQDTRDRILEPDGKEDKHLST